MLPSMLMVGTPGLGTWSAWVKVLVATALLPWPSTTEMAFTVTLALLASKLMLKGSVYFVEEVVGLLPSVV